MAKKGLLWFLSIPVVLGGYAIVKNVDKIKNIKFDKIKEKNLDRIKNIKNPFLKKLPVNDIAFDADEKSLSVIKSHVTRNINQQIENCNWFAIGKTNSPETFINNFNGKEIILLAKSKDPEVISNLVQIYTEKYKENENTTSIEEKIDDTPEKVFYLYIIIG
ncbi:MAG: hypothetical protein JXL97_05390 [Bacteroidales bacterium]|nr:hypothetical protein [Bacteroidales bacterium]